MYAYTRKAIDEISFIFLPLLYLFVQLFAHFNITASIWTLCGVLSIDLLIVLPALNKPEFWDPWKAKKSPNPNGGICQ